jgi:hypothetical protein
MKYLILIILLSGCSSIPGTRPIMFDYYAPDPTKPVDWGLAPQRYGEKNGSNSG